MSEPASPVETIRFPVRGMTCGACVSRISRAIRRLDGIENVRVDLGAETVTVRRAPAGASNAALAVAVAEAGYAAELEAAERLPPGAERSLLDRLLGS